MSVFDYIKWSPKLTRMIYNLLYCRIANRQKCTNQDALLKLKDLRNIHKDKRCFIIGTGPSLTISDLELLTNEITFAPNRIFEILQKTEWRPTYYVCQDHDIINKFSDKITSISAKIKFLPVEYRSRFVGDEYRYFVLKENDYYPHDAKFSVDISNHISQGYTVTYGAIQIAVYMGFKEIYLIGIDHNYSIVRDSSGRPVKLTDSKNYSENMMEYINLKNLPRIEESTIAYETAEKITRKKGVKIFNATRGGKLEAFERIDLDKLFCINE